MVEILVIVGMFLLRFGLPLAITVSVAYLLRRLDAKWQAEAQAQWAAEDPVYKEIVDTLASLEGQKLCRKTPEYGMIISELDPNCALLDIPCWMARLRATGRLPDECRECKLFTASLAS